VAKNTTPIEYEEDKVFAQWCRLKKLKFSHIPNETYTPSMGARIRNQQSGVDSGVPDYVVLTPKGVIWVEMKRRKGSITSPAQLEWIEAINAIPGTQAQVCKGAQEAIDFVSKFIQKKSPRNWCFH